LVQRMYDALGDDGKHKHTAQGIADELGAAGTTIYRYLERSEA
jgi:response regulator of citrate/malate metabolism